MTKWIAIGDIHGRDTWKAIVEKEAGNVDYIIFVGDYFDSFDISVKKQVSNFKELLALKESVTLHDKIILLTGNHDYHYLPHMNTGKMSRSECYSGYRYDRETLSLLKYAYDNKLIQMAYLIDNRYLFTHAGVTNTWLDRIINEWTNDAFQNSDLAIDEIINDCFVYRPHLFKFSTTYKSEQDGAISAYGDNIWQSPLWVRPDSLSRDSVDYFQIVGHTENINNIQRLKLPAQGLIIDALDKMQYLYCDGISEPVIKTF
jgi:hypothetical protein